MWITYCQYEPVTTWDYTVCKLRNVAAELTRGGFDGYDFVNYDMDCIRRHFSPDKLILCVEKNTGRVSPRSDNRIELVEHAPNFCVDIVTADLVKKRIMQALEHEKGNQPESRIPRVSCMSACTTASSYVLTGRM